MTLEEYLFEKGLLVYEFAELIGYCKNYISGIKNGTRKPTKKLRYRIIKATEGKVVLDVSVHKSAMKKEKPIAPKDKQLGEKYQKFLQNDFLDKIDVPEHWKNKEAMKKMKKAIEK